MNRAIAILLVSFSISSFAEEPEGLKRYREKMAYWQERWESAFKCDNRYKVAMFMYESTLEEGAAGSEELSTVVEEFSLKNPDCIVKSLEVLNSNQVEAVIKNYYEPPLYREPEVFSDLVAKLRVNKALKAQPSAAGDAASGAP